MRRRCVRMSLDRAQRHPWTHGRSTKSRTGRTGPARIRWISSLRRILPRMTEFFRPDVQTLPRDQLRALQDERLRALIHRIFNQPIPFFRDKLQAAGIGPDDIKSVDDMPKIPRTVKQELRDDEAAHPP